MKLEDLNKYRKTVVALVGAAVVTALQFYPTNKYVLIAVAFLTALGVYQIPNKEVK